MQPRVTVLQLDTNFPRIPGDIGCPDTFRGPVQIIKVPGARVGEVVTARPDQIDIKPFEAALAKATGNVVATSCGFLSYWQDHLASMTAKPFVCSSLIALDDLSKTYASDEILICTFDPQNLNARHLRGHEDYVQSVVGLSPQLHLRQLIEGAVGRLDIARAEQEITDLVGRSITPKTRHILLECTNLPPYKARLQGIFGLPVTDILDLIEQQCPGSIHDKFLSNRQG